MALLTSIANKLSVMAARQQLNKGTIGNPYFVGSAETQAAVQTLKRLGTPQDRWEASRFEDVQQNGLDLGREIQRMGIGS